MLFELNEISLKIKFNFFNMAILDLKFLVNISVLVNIEVLINDGTLILCKGVNLK